MYRVLAVKDTKPSKSSPHHWTSCFKRDLYLPLDCDDSPINAEYVENMTPLFILPLTAEDILAYFN